MSRLRAADTGTLEAVPLSDLLVHLEASGQEGELRLETPHGLARLWFRDGYLLDAEAGDATGEAAVLRALTATAGTYTIEIKPIERLRVIHESIPALLGRSKRRSEDWQRLVAEMPSLDTVLWLDAARYEAMKSRVPPVDAKLLELVDSRRTIVDIVDDSGFDAIAALERLAWYIRARLLRTARGSLAPRPSEPPQSRPRLSDSAPPKPPSRGHHSPPPPAKTSSNPPAATTSSNPPRPGSIVPAPIVAVSHPKGAEAHAPPPRRRSAPPARTQIGLMPPEVRAAARSTRPLHEAPGLGGVSPIPPPPALPSFEPPPRERIESAPTPSDPPPSDLDQSAPLPPERTVLGRYEILSRIARGGMGTVYLCRVTGEGGFRRLFALKVLRRHLARDQAAAEMFLREARVSAGIYDPHVVGIVDVGTYGSQPYLVMDYIEGGSFHDLLQRHPRYRPPRLVIPIVLDALSGLMAAHTLTDESGDLLGLVHCDVSPHNLLVGVDGTGRLSDFGIAKARLALTDGGSISTRGKPAFLSPEQATHQPVDHRADIFSVGVMLWNALTGERLFDGDGIEQTLENVLTRPVPPPSTVGLRPPPCLDAICLKALARDPAQRYQSAEHMMRDLRAVALREDLLAPPSDVAKWVAGTFGPELQVRRLAALDASRRARGAEAPRHLPDVDRLSEPPLALPAHVSEAPPDSGPVSSDDRSRTLVLRPHQAEAPFDAKRGRILIAAAVVSFVAVLLSLLFPNGVARLFRVDPEAPLPSSTFSRDLSPPPGPSSRTR